MVEPVVWVVVPQMVALLGLVARLCWRAVRERRRQETLRELANSLAGSGGEVEVDDVREDGSRLRVRLVATGTPRRECR